MGILNFAPISALRQAASQAGQYSTTLGSAKVIKSCAEHSGVPEQSRPLEGSPGSNAWGIIFTGTFCRVSSFAVAVAVQGMAAQ